MPAAPTKGYDFLHILFFQKKINYLQYQLNGRTKTSLFTNFSLAPHCTSDILLDSRSNYSGRPKQLEENNMANEMSIAA